MSGANFFFPALMLAVGIIHAEPVAIAAAVFCYFLNGIFSRKA